MDKNKQDITSDILKIIEVVLDSGIDEGAHHWGVSSHLKAADIRKFTTDVNLVDKLIIELRPIVLEKLDAVIESYQEEEAREEARKQ